MSSSAPNKVFIQIESADEQKQNLRLSRKTLKILQKAATDKENLAGRHATKSQLQTKADIKTKLEIQTNEIPSISSSKRKKLLTNNSSCQTDPEDDNKISEDDLTTDGEPSENYWKSLAEKRRIALDDSLEENEKLCHKVTLLEEELHTSRKMLDETRNLVQVLTDMLEEDDSDDKSDGQDEENKEHEPDEIANNILNLNRSKGFIKSDLTDSDGED